MSERLSIEAIAMLAVTHHWKDTATMDAAKNLCIRALNEYRNRSLPDAGEGEPFDAEALRNSDNSGTRRAMQYADALRTRLAALQSELAQARECIREIITEDCPMPVLDDYSIKACVLAYKCGCCWQKHAAVIAASAGGKDER